MSFIIKLQNFVIIFVIGFYGVGGACDFINYLDYINTWNNRYYTEAQKMYPFGDTYCDQNQTSNGKNVGFNPGITFPVHFYGVKYSSLWINPHGIISLNETMNPPALGYHYIDQWPNDNYPDAYDPPFIAPFYSEADFKLFDPPTTEPSAFSWRILDPTDQTKPSNEQQITIGMLDALSQEIRLGVVGADSFQAEYGLIITWYKVTFDASPCKGTSCVRNTYQMALLVGGTGTYVIFNYFDINWIGGAGIQQCDPSTGVKSSSHQNCKAAHIGFNAGYGRVFNALPYSNNVDTTKDIDKKSGSNIVGRFIYSVAGDKIVRGGCTNDTTLDNTAWPLEASPIYTDMIGGTAVDVSGPCFHKNNVERVKCKFGEIPTDPVIRTDTTMKAICVPPPLDFVGVTKLSMSDDGGISYKYDTQIVINLLGRNEPRAQASTTGQDWLNPVEITITWNPDDLQHSTNTVDVILMGYKEDGQPGEVEVATWEHLETIADSYSNSGTYKFNPSAVQCGSGSAERIKCFEYHLGAIKVAEHRDDPLNPRSVWTEIVPFGWYIKTEMQVEYGTEWAAYICQEWFYLDERNGGWTDRSHLPLCPCTLQQAMADYGRYQTDVGCHQDSSRPDNCKLNIGAVHCVVSTYTTQTQGSGNRCCYNSDHTLIYSGDNMYGSRPDRAHEWGLHPYGLPPRIPTMSHWIKDVAPWYYCCQWPENKDKCYNLYLMNRLTVDCYNYESPGHAASFGDPHFSTFDGTVFTFNGHGEFWLLNVNDVILHGEAVDFYIQHRMQQPKVHIWGDVPATFTTAIAMKLTHTAANSGQTVTFTIDEFYENSDNKLLVYVDHELLSFSEHHAYVQEFDDFVIINNDPETLKSATNFTVSYRLGIGIMVSFHNGLIHCMMAAPPEFKEKTSGLIGAWNGMPGQDLIPKGGGSPISPDDMEALHYSYGLTWMITGSESLFEYIYRANLNYNYYRDETFTPEFTPGPPTPNTTSSSLLYNNNNDHLSSFLQEEQEVPNNNNNVCGDNVACQYDYMVTGNENVAMETKSAQEKCSLMRTMSTKVLSCGWLSIQNSIKKEPYNYFVGSTVIIEGCRDTYKLQGPTTFVCEDTGGSAVWNPAPMSTRCIGPDEALSPAVIAAIAVPVVLVAFLIIFGIIILCIWMHKRRTEGKPTRKAEQDSNYIDDSFSQALPPLSLKTSGKPRPAVTHNRSYCTDTDTSMEKIPVNMAKEYVDNPYSDIMDVKKTTTSTHAQNVNKGTTSPVASKQNKKRKSANLDDSISIESEKDKVVLNASNGEISVANSNNSPRTKQKVITVSYKPDPTAQKPDKREKRPKNEQKLDYSGNSSGNENPPLLSNTQRQAPYRYPNTASSNMDVLAGYINPKRNPYYNPYDKPSPTQNRYPPYVYPRNDRRLWSNQSTPTMQHAEGFKYPRSGGSESDF